MIRYKNLRSRLLAWIFDSMIVGLITFFLELFRSLDNFWLNIIITFASINVLFIYRIYLHNKTGQTFGKRIVNIQVVDSQTERHLSREQSFMREIIPMLVVNFSILALYIITWGNSESFEYSGLGVTMILIPSILIVGWYVADFISGYFNSKERVLHDLIANTTVVRK